MPEPATIPLDATVLGFDVGSRRIGVAVGNPLGAGARAVAVIDVHGAGPDWNALDRVHREQSRSGDGGAVVVGERAHW